MSQTVRAVVGVLATAWRLLARHWPALLTLALAGAAVRAGALWAAVTVSDAVPILGQLLLVLAPLGYLLPVIAMLHICGSSLPSVAALTARRGPQAATAGRRRRLVDVAVSVLVPFLAVYVSYGLLQQDIDRFRNEAAFAEFNRFDLTQTLDYDFAGRLGIYPAVIAAMIVAIAWVLRWTLGRLERTTKFLALAFVGALVEVYYAGQVAGQVVVVKSAGTEWLDGRVAVAWVRERYDALLDHLGWFAHPVDAVTSFVLGLLGSLDAVVIVPLAWLTVGAVVLGHKLTPPAAAKHGYLERLSIVPKPVRTGLRSLFADIAERFSALWNGSRLLGRSGLAPMLVFGVAFLVVIRIPTLFSYAVRAVVGPVETDTWLAFSPMESSIGLALSMVLVAPMLAAALDALLRAEPDDAAAAEPAASSPEGASAPAG